MGSCIAIYFELFLLCISGGISSLVVSPVVLWEPSFFEAGVVASFDSKFFYSFESLGDAGKLDDSAHYASMNIE